MSNSRTELVNQRVSEHMSAATKLHCACGGVLLEVEGAPIVSVECCCNSCRAAAVRLKKLENAPAIMNDCEATPLVLYRADRVRFLAGADKLKEFRLSPKSGTRRVLASCCNTPVFMDVKGGHWLSLYGLLWPAKDLPALEMRTMTSDLAEPSLLPADVPNLKKQSWAFFARLIHTWVAMRFRNPKIPVNGVINA